MLHCPACQREFPNPAGTGIPHRCPHCGSLVVGHYCDLDLIGSGAMGDVFRARRPDMGNRTVAIKIPKVAEPQVCRRFEREIAASARLRHENIVCAFDRGEEEGRPYLVMEYVAGRPLADLVDAEHPLSPARVAGILQQVACGLAHAAAQRIVNRDIKPDNILIAHDGGLAKIMDYGLGLIADLDGNAERVTRNGTLLGTPSFLAPEQARDPRSVTIAADVYALGCTAYYMLVRRTPFPATDSQSSLRQHAEAPRPTVRTVRPDVPAELEQLIQEMMAVDPHGRPSPKDLARRLEQLLPNLSDLRPPVASKTMAGMFDVTCPGCGEVYHMRADTLGKQMTCRKNVCRTRFNIGQQVAMTQAMTPSAGLASPLNPGERGEGEAVEAEVVEAELVDAEVVEAEIVEAEAVEPLEAIVAEVVAAEPAESPPIIETVAVTAAQIDTPMDESIAVLPVEAVVHRPKAVRRRDPLPSAGSAPPVQRVGIAADRANSDADIPPLPAGAVQSAPRTAAQLKSAPLPRRRKPANIMLWTVATATLLMLIGSAVVGWKVYRQYNLTPEERWAKAQELYQSKKWALAEKAFTAIQTDFPESPQASHVPFFLSMCEMGSQIYSPADNAVQCLEKMESLYREYRDQPVYKLYPSDLYAALQRLVERFTEQATQRLDLDQLAHARTAFNLLNTVAQAMDVDWVAGRTTELAEFMAKTERTVKASRAQTDTLAALERLKNADPEANPDAIYAQIDATEKQFPELAKSREFQQLRDAAYRAEAARVRYFPYVPDPTLEVADDARAYRDDGTQFVVWGQPPSTPAGNSGDRVVMALARGVLYVFDPQGAFLWARRLGVDTHRLPGRIEATATSPAALIAVSSEDNTLLALEATTGRVLWRYAVGGDIVAPLTIVSIRGGPYAPDKKRGLLPTTNADGTGGVIHVLELVLGKRLGHFDVGHPMSVGGTYDSSTGLVFFPADSKRVFAINLAAVETPDAPACRSVLMTNHASGALRNEPAVVGQYERGQEYLILSEASELDQMKLRAFEIKADGFADPRAAPLKEATLRGWSWFAPRSTPDRITLVTDDGDLGLFGLNLDNREEALYRLVDDPSMQLHAGDRHRALAVHADEHLLWAMVGGVLRKFSLDLLKQKVRPLWQSEKQAAEVFGIPLHEAQMDRFGTTFYLASMSASGSRYDLTAVDSDTGAALWQRQLGITPAGDPLVDANDNQRVLLTDQSGGIVQIAADQNQTVTEQAGTGELPLGADPRTLMEVAQVDGVRRVALPLRNRTELALAALDGASQAGLTWQSFKLDSPLRGRPAVVQGPALRVGGGASADRESFLIVPTESGLLRRISLDAELTTLVNEQWFQWSETIPPSGLATADIYPLGENALLVIDGQRRVRRIEFRTEPVPQWEAVGNAFETSGSLVHRPLIAGSRVFVLTADGVLRALSAMDPSRELGTWIIAGRISSEPVVRGKRIVIVVDERKLVCIDPIQPELHEPVWQSAPSKGRIRGVPTLAGDVLLLADDSRRITGIRLSDGQPAWTQRIGVRAGPASAPVAFGADRILVPLTDGTLWTLPLPVAAPSQEVTP